MFSRLASAIKTTNFFHFSTFTTKLTKKYSTQVTMNIVQFDDKFKKSVNEFLKQQNIKNFNMSFEYCEDSLDYVGNVSVNYFTQKKVSENELDYYIKMSNEFVYKN